MKRVVIVSGSRNARRGIAAAIMERAFNLHADAEWWIMGDRDGVGAIARDMLIKRNVNPVVVYDSWESKLRGSPDRNRKMTDLALAIADKEEVILLAFPSDTSTSRGTYDMIRCAERAGIEVRTEVIR